MTPEQEKELWRSAVANKTFDLIDDLNDLRNRFLALVGDESVLLVDKYLIVERQLKVCDLELKNLRAVITKIHFKE